MPDKGPFFVLPIYLDFFSLSFSIFDIYFDSQNSVVFDSSLFDVYSLSYSCIIFKWCLTFFVYLLHCTRTHVIKIRQDKQAAVDFQCIINKQQQHVLNFFFKLQRSFFRDKFNFACRECDQIFSNYDTILYEGRYVCTNVVCALFLEVEIINYFL